MSLSPQDYVKLKAFRDLIRDTRERLGQAGTQGALSQAVAECAPRWDAVDGAFAQVLRDVGGSVWKMPFTQVRPTVQTIVDHLGGQLADIEDELRRG